MFKEKFENCLFNKAYYTIEEFGEDTDITNSNI